MLDHRIENGDIPPLIVVCATFDAQNRAQSFSRSVEELSVFHRDLRENLIPFVESRYRTDAQDVTEAGLRASRAHRAFGGFSLGGGHHLVSVPLQPGLHPVLRPHERGLLGHGDRTAG